MPRLIKKEVDKLYKVMCEAVAYDIQNNSDTIADKYDIVDDTAKYVIKAIGRESFLSDFEKTVRDYFAENGLNLTYETLASDISKYF